MRHQRSGCEDATRHRAAAQAQPIAHRVRPRRVRAAPFRCPSRSLRPDRPHSATDRHRSPERIDRRVMSHRSAVPAHARSTGHSSVRHRSRSRRDRGSERSTAPLEDPGRSPQAGAGRRWPTLMRTAPDRHSLGVRSWTRRPPPTATALRHPSRARCTGPLSHRSASDGSRPAYGGSVVRGLHHPGVCATSPFRGLSAGPAPGISTVRRPTRSDSAGGSPRANRGSAGCLPRFGRRHTPDLPRAVRDRPPVRRQVTTRG